MKSRADLLPADPPPVPKVPVWARPRGVVVHDADAAYAAGAALNSLNNLVRQDLPWAGAWRQRLALRNATTAVNVTGRREDESALLVWIRRVAGLLEGAGHYLIVDPVRDTGRRCCVVAVIGRDV